MKRKSGKQAKKAGKKPRDLKPKRSVRGGTGGREQQYYTITLTNANVANTALTNASLMNKTR